MCGTNNFLEIQYNLTCTHELENTAVKTHNTKQLHDEPKAWAM